VAPDGAAGTPWGQTRFGDTVPVAPGASLHPRLEAQIDAAEFEPTHAPPRLQALLETVSSYYHLVDEERRGTVRSMQLMSEEARSFTREMAEQSSEHLQLILDHIKDVVITLDANGHIQTLNRTGERVFGYAQTEVVGRRIDVLVPAIGERGSVVHGLQRRARTTEEPRAPLAGAEILARQKGGAQFAAELAVSAARVNRRDVFIVCLRDATERRASEQAIRESEARYRTLVDNAPEVIMVFDMESRRFCDVNEHAQRFFHMTREQLLAVGPAELSPPTQPDGEPSDTFRRGHLDGALAGEPQTFEWTHRDAFGVDIPCEVRLVRLPSASRRLLRGSITDISERKRTELAAAREREVFERLAANEPLAQVLIAIARLVESLCTGTVCSISVLAPDGKAFASQVAPNLPERLRAVLERSLIDIRSGSCAAAVYLGRVVQVADVTRDPFWESRREMVLEAGLRAAWSIPIKGSSGSILAALGVYRREPGIPRHREMQWTTRAAQLAGIAIERRLSEEALRGSEAKFRGLFEAVMEGVYQSTRDGRLLSVNPAMVQMLAYPSAEELYALPSASMLYWNAADRAEFARRIEAEGEIRNAEFCLRRRDGDPIFVLENARCARDANGRVTGYEGTLVDITERKLAEQAVFAEKERAQVTLQAIGDAVISTDAAGLVEYLNPIAERLTGWSAGEAHGRDVDTILTLLDDGKREPLASPVRQCLASGAAVTPTDRAVLVNRNGGEIAIQDSATPIRDRQGTIIGAVIVFHDVTRERRLQRALAYQASHDALTGLINRREFDNRLQLAVQRARQSDARHVLLYLDLDQFKIVNDSCGHPAGDRLIREITSILQTRVRASDIIARLGGDEFGVLLEDCSLEHAMTIAENLRHAIREHRFVWDTRTLGVGASIGLVEIDAETATAESAMSAADIACYAAKDEGRNRIHVYDSAANSGHHREMLWVSRVTEAVADNRLVIYEQLIVPIAGRTALAPFYELTVRLLDPAGNLVPPAEFIPAAERYHVMPTIDRWVVGRAVAGLHARLARAEPLPLLCLNLSGTSLNEQPFLEHVLNELSDPQIARALCFELTESAALASLPSAVYFMRELKARGCRFSLDDFGRGLSSVMYLKTLPVDFLKIDGQCVAQIANDPVDRSMVEAIAQVGRTLGIYTIAEDVDSPAVLAELERIGVDFAQGSHLVSPHPWIEESL
jgi:diguanylate cyclase (GGDEF)-like protein/PAS domain S-box-containing protein